MRILDEQQRRFLAPLTPAERRQLPLCSRGSARSEPGRVTPEREDLRAATWTTDSAIRPVQHQPGVPRARRTARWAQLGGGQQGRRFDDLFSLVADPTFMLILL